jgi:hypothetical protein
MKKRLAWFLAVTIGTAGMIGLIPMTAAAVPVSGCPSGYELRSVESLAATGNVPLPGIIDAAGNGDGYVCAHPLPDAVCIAHGYDPCLVETVYEFKDNRL